MVSKNKILTWIIVLLVVMNISTIASVIYHNYQEQKLVEESIIIDGQNINGRFVRDKLGFDNEQLDAFREANHGFRPIARQVIFQIDSLKEQMFTELRKQTSDTVMLAAFSKQIGDLHGELKHRTFEYYLNLKAICTMKQLPALEQIFAPLFNNERMNAWSGRQGGGQGMGRGGRNIDQ